MRLHQKNTLYIKDEFIGNNKNLDIHEYQNETVIFNNCVFENAFGMNRVEVKHGTIILEANNRFHGNVEIECQKLIIKQSLTPTMPIELKNIKIEAEEIIFDKSNLKQNEIIKLLAQEKIGIRTEKLTMKNVIIGAKKDLHILTSEPNTVFEDSTFKAGRSFRIYNVSGSIKIDTCDIITTEIVPEITTAVVEYGIVINSNNKNHSLTINNTHFYTDQLKIYHNNNLTINKTTLEQTPALDSKNSCLLSMYNNEAEYLNKIQNEETYGIISLDKYSLQEEKIIDNSSIDKLKHLFINVLNKK